MNETVRIAGIPHGLPFTNICPEKAATAHFEGIPEASRERTKVMMRLGQNSIRIWVCVGSKSAPGRRKPQMMSVHHRGFSTPSGADFHPTRRAARKWTISASKAPHVGSTTSRRLLLELIHFRCSTAHILIES
jgi:hypothetical protein